MQYTSQQIICCIYKSGTFSAAGAVPSAWGGVAASPAPAVAAAAAAAGGRVAAGAAPLSA